MRKQWIQGLQWGGCAWLGWVAWSAFRHATHCSIPSGPDFLIIAAWFAQRWALALVWIAALLLTWTRWSRIGVGVAIVVQAILGTIEAGIRTSEMSLPWALAYWLPMSLPVLPFLFMEPEHPRFTLALLLVGRWRDALAQLKGLRWLAVAAGVFFLNRLAWMVLVGLEMPDTFTSYSPVFLALAAIPRRRKPATA